MITTSGTKHKTQLLTVLIILIFISTGPSAFAVKSADDELLFNEASRRIGSGDYTGGAVLYKKIIRISDEKNNISLAHYLLGSTFRKYLGNNVKAFTHYNKVIRSFHDTPSAEDAVFSVGTLYFELKQYRNAYKTFQKYLKFYPKSMRTISVRSWSRKSFLMLNGELPSEPLNRNELLPYDSSIKVLLESNRPTVKISAGGTLKIVDENNIRSEYKGSSPLTFTKYGRFLRAGKTVIKSSSCRISSSAETTKINGASYRGEFIIYSEPGGLLIVNVLPVEQYLYGVIAREMISSWPEQALMAQAIAARTFALYKKINTPPGSKFSLEPTTNSQVYGGYDSEETSSIDAVNKTKSLVLAYDGELIISYYHSNSGGHTEEAGMVWGTSYPYLKGKPDGHSLLVPNTKWEFFITYNDLNKLFGTTGLISGKINGITAEKGSLSGRFNKVNLVTDNNSIALNSNKFRMIIGPRRLKSTLFGYMNLPEGIIFSGSGYGHGVGMSQWGAYQMALSGYHYNEILRHYYSGAYVTALTGLSK